MSDAVRIGLPAELAEALIDEGEVVPSVMTRSVGEVVHVVVEATNSGASAITVAAAMAAMPKVMNRVAQYVRRRQPNETSKVVLRQGGRDLVIEIPRELTLEDASALLTRTFVEASAS